MFDKEALFALNDTTIEKVDCPEWGELGKQIHVRTMSGKSRDAYEMGIVNARKKDDEGFLFNMRASLAVACCCDVDGKLLFEPKDADRLGNMSAAALDRIFTVGQRLSKMSTEDVKEMEKSLESDQS